MERTGRVLILGEPESSGFEALARVLTTDCRPDETRVIATADEAASLLEESDWRPDVIIVVQRYPEEFAPSVVHRLHSLAPFARWIVCVGPWCESAGRTGIAWPLALCVPARTCGARLDAVWSDHRAGRPPLPLTASRDEAFECDLPVIADARLLTGRRVTVSSPDRAVAELLVSVCRRCGAEVVTESAARNDVDVVVWDVDPMDDASADYCRISLLESTSFRGAKGDNAPPVIAVTGSVAPEDVARLLSAGAVAVVSKLGIVAELPVALSAVSKPS